jgi:hypothetical protein
MWGMEEGRGGGILLGVEKSRSPLKELNYSKAVGEFWMWDKSQGNVVKQAN